MNKRSYYRGLKKGYSGGKLSPIQEMFVSLGQSGINLWFWEGYKQGILDKFIEDLELV